MTEQQTFWQQEDKSIIGRIFLMVGVFAIIMAVIAVGLSFAL